ncbi:MAG: HEAT repeat domain-containing protein [Chloroflexota bacterium]
MRSLREEEDLMLASLYRMSDLTPEELSHFYDHWPKVDEERRRVIVRHLADISEENFQVDFGAVFAHCLSDETPAVRLAALDGLWDSERTSLLEPIIGLMLSDPEEDVRTLAAATLGHYILLAEWDVIPLDSVRVAVDALLAVLDEIETPKPLRRAALESISASSHDRVQRLVREAYDSGDHELQVSAVYAMGRMVDKSWLPIILDEMMSSSSEMRLEAARAAGHIGSTDAVADLVELISDEDLEVQLVAITAMGQIGGSLAIRVLDEMDGDPDFAHVQHAIEEALEEAIWMDNVDLALFDWDNDEEGDRHLSV